MVDYGDFEEVVEGKQITTQEGEVIARARMPQKGEYIGVIVQRLGGNRMEVHTTDGKTRNCRVPGRFKRTLWLRPKDVVLITPWTDDDSKGDVIFKYNSSAINQLRKKGILDSLKSDF
ncbi:translation initiation factor IF-1A [Candidatus Pacearchaeota archaeon]|nr:translation initiation factor IF-1A [Candidatus Pacearchaeota archaeon]